MGNCGEIYYGPDISKEVEKLNKLQRRCQKDIRIMRDLERTNPFAEQSNRAKKRRIKLNKQYRRIHNIEESFIQMTTKKIINMNPIAIVMETLAVNDMKKNHLVASAIQFSSFARCKEVMKYKCRNYNIPFIEADRIFKSSQICSNCGHEKDIKRNKNYICPVCGLKIDRDINAAINLENLGYEKLNIPNPNSVSLISA